MHVKKSLMLWVAVFALVLPLLLAGTASAKYIGDGAVPDGVGGLKAPADGVCVIGLQTDGTMIIDSTITTARDCQARLVDVTAVTSNDTLANVCVKPASNTAGVRYAAPGSSTCVTVDGSLFINGSLSLVDLDRNAKMCTAKGGFLANAGATIVKNTANGTAAKCIAYGWQYRGQNEAGASLPFGTEGTDASTGAGFCYATLRTGITTTAACPSSSPDPTVKYGYSMVGGANCVYSYGISGPLSANMTAIDGTITAAGTNVDLSAKTTMGDCLAFGASWNNWVRKNGTDIVNSTATIATFDLTRQTGATTEGCLHCHSYTSQQNGPAERFKDSYLKTGHRNMLRKVTAGQPWSGPNAAGVLEQYTAWGAGGVNSIDWALATTTTGTYTLPLLYIFGDWMAPAPDGLDVVVMNGTAKYNNGNAYSCAACHTTGWSNNATVTAGLCNYSSKTTQATCEAVTSGAFGAGVWTPMTGVMGASYNPVQPGESFPAYKNADNTITGITGRWDLDGIQCSRCHEGDATGGTHHTKPVFGPSGGEAATNLCFSCHQSMAKTSNGLGTDADIANPTALIVKNNNTTGGYTPGFSGHVLGNSFLNSPHARFSGTVTPNALGKYDISTGGTYSSTFKGYMCYQGATSSSGAKTMLVGAEIHEIKDKATCETMYGAGAWRPDTRGGCTSCHDVHQSLFVAGQEALRKECVSCHNNSTYAGDVPGTSQTSILNHPTGPGTPDGINPADPCIVCHMPKPTAADFPMHVWRINSDANYSTFPTATEFGVGATATRKNANTAADGAYTNAVWVDLDLACGQCHGGSKGSGATQNGAGYKNKAELASRARIMHGLTAIGRFTATTDAMTSYVVNFDASASSNAETYDWNFGDGSTGSGVITSHTYTNSSMRIVTLTLNNDVTVSRTVTPVVVNHAPVAGGLSAAYPSTSLAPYVVTNATNEVSFMDGSTDVDNNITSVVVKWGDGTVSTAASAGAPFSHTYARAGKYTITMTVKDAGNKYSYDKAFVKIVPQTYSISGIVKNAVGTPLSGATLYLKMSGHTRAIKRSAPTTGAYSFTNVTAGAYTVTTLKTGYALSSVSTGAVSANVTGFDITLTPK